MAVESLCAVSTPLSDTWAEEETAAVETPCSADRSAANFPFREFKAVDRFCRVVS